MTEVLWILLGLLIGAAIGVYLGMIRGRRGVEAELSSASNDAAGALATMTELRNQLAARDREMAEVRSALEAEKVAGADAKARLDSARDHFAEQKRQIEQMQEKAREAFAALSSRALQNNNEQFITLAETKFKPIREQLQRYEEQVKAIEEARNKAYGGLKEKLDALENRSDRLSSETGQLVAALRQPGAKGRWGEVTLQRIVELCQMSEHCDFVTQPSLESGLRPDMVIHLPGGRNLVVDSKVSTSAFLDAAATTSDEERKRHLDRYVSGVRTTLRSLSGREYWRQFSPAPEFVVMFMPGEAFFSTALSHDRNLLEDGVKQNVLLASPSTLIALLLAVRHGWQQQKVADNAREIAAAGRELYDRLCVFVNHLDAIRVGLDRAGSAYNNAVGSWTSRAEPSARRLKELGAADDAREISELKPVETALRELPTTEATGIENRISSDE